MIEEVRPVAQQLRLPNAEQPRFRGGAGSVLALPLGEIACDLRPLTERASRRIASYELRIANETPQALPAFAYAAATPVAAPRIKSEAFVVPPFGALAVTIDVAVARGGAPPRLIVELHGEHARLTLEAGPPLRRGRRRATLAGAVLSGVALVAAVLGLGRTFAPPHVVALALPPGVEAGTPFAVAYASSGASEAHYSVASPDGTPVAAGTLPQPSGAFTLALPPAAISHGYDVSVVARGRFGGEDVRSAHVVALPPPAPTPPPVVVSPYPVRVSDVRLAKNSVAGGDPITVAYRATSPSGTVRLIDQVGTVRAEALLSSRGRTIVMAPYVAADQDWRVVVSVQHGDRHVEAAVPVRLLQPAPAPSHAKAATRGGGPGDPDAAIALARTTFYDAEPIAVQIQHFERGLRIAIRDYSGQELAARRVFPSDDEVVLPAPDTTGGRRFVVVATFLRGIGEDTTVLPFTVEAAPHDGVAGRRNPSENRIR